MHVINTSVKPQQTVTLVHNWRKARFFLFDADVNGYILVLGRSVQNADCGLQTEYKKRFVLFNVVVVEEM